MPETITSEPALPASPEKKRYHAPRIDDLGDVAAMTRTAAQGPNFDGGGGANIYAS